MATIYTNDIFSLRIETARSNTLLYQISYDVADYYVIRRIIMADYYVEIYAKIGDKIKYKAFRG